MLYSMLNSFQTMMFEAKIMAVESRNCEALRQMCYNSQSVAK